MSREAPTVAVCDKKRFISYPTTPYGCGLPSVVVGCLYAFLWGYVSSRRRRHRQFPLHSCDVGDASRASVRHLTAVLDLAIS